MNEIAKPKNQASDVLRFRTIELILSVTEANVSSGSITGAVECIGPSTYGLFSLVSSATVLMDVRVRVFQLRLVTRARPRVQFTEQRIVALVVLQSVDATRRIVHIAEVDRLGRTSSLTRSDDLAVAHFAVFQLRLNLRVLNALHAVSALLHHATTTHTHFGIAHQLISRRVPVLIKEEVEPAHLVRAVVGTILRAHAAVVDHVVQSFRAVHGGVNRTNRLARRILRSEEHTSELQSRRDLVCRLLLEKKK